MSEFWVNFFSYKQFIPHGHCYLWKPQLVWLNVIADGLIALSYYSIPLLLIYFVHKRKDIPFQWIFLLFGAFIVSCGTTHLVEIWTLWHPAYWISSSLKAMTAMVSFYTAVEMVPLLPKALALPSPAQLEAANKALEEEIVERKRIEQELQAYKEHLEEIVEQRTAELATTNHQLQQEIRDRQQSQEQLAQLLKEVESANQELNDFAYVVSHDLKAPLRGISSVADWLITDYADKFDPAGQELVNLLINRVQRIHNLIDDILQYSRIGRVRETRVTVDLNQTLADVIELVDPPSHIQIKIQDRLPLVLGEKTRLEQLFQNLLSNALKFIDKPQGEVTITYTASGDYWQFCIADNGVGIEEKYFNKIFQLFQKLSTTHDAESTGVGLALVKKIVEMYGGSVWVESQVGYGSQFFFTLPRAITLYSNREIR